MTDLTKIYRTESEGWLPHLVVDVNGLERDGKSTFALTAPDPICYIWPDIGAREAIARARAAGKIIYDCQLKVPHIAADLSGSDEKKKKRSEELKTAAGPIYKDFQAAYKAAIGSDEIRTVVWDTATEIWEITRLAHFGKLTEVKPQHYGPVNAEFRHLIRMAYEAEKNLIMIHKLKSEYLNNQKTRNYERAGFSTVGYEVDTSVRVEHDRKGEVFKITVHDCRYNTDIEGEEYEDEMCSFPWLASLALPDTEMDYWL